MTDPDDPVMKELKALRRDVNLMFVGYGAAIVILAIVLFLASLKT